MTSDVHGKAGAVVDADELTSLLARLRRLGTAIVDAALAYSRLGIPVFPCHPNSKRPLVGEGFYAATVDQLQLRAWWRKWPSAMIGIPTGKASGFLLIDLDPVPGQSADSLLEQLRVRVGGRLPAGLIAHTPRGGMHLLYAMPDRTIIGNRANLLGAGNGQGKVDIRAEGGYMIAAPSRRCGAQAKREGCDGRFYEWDAVEGPGEDFALPSPSPALVDLISRNDQPAAASRVAAASRRTGELPIPGHRERRYAKQAFDHELYKLACQNRGGRNHALNIASMKLAQLVAAGALSDTDVQNALEEACERNGLIRDDGVKAVRATIASGFRKGLAEPRKLQHFSSPVKPPNGRPSGRKTGQSPEMAAEQDERAVLRIKPSLLHEAVNRAEQILVDAGPGPIFQRGGELVHVTHRPVLRSDGSAEVQEAIAFAGPAFFSRILAEHARCERYAMRDKEWLPCDPPTKLAEQYYSLPEWKLPTLRQLISAPLIRRDGTLLHGQGYDPATGLYLTQELDGLRVPECPSAYDAETANEALTDLLKDFPWSDPPGRAGLSLAVAVAGVIAAVIRAILPTAPAFAVTAPARGNGKSYFVDLAAIIATGVRAACVATGGNLEELEKSLFAQLLEGRSVLNLDNMVQPLAGQLLCMVLTQSQVRSRVLGLSKMADASTGSTIFATGNNLAVKGDMVRRTLIATMDAGLEHPENRSFDRDLLAEVLARRAELVGAVLTLIRWRLQWRMDASQPLQSITDALPLAGYSEFCRLVRDPLMALGHPDPIRSIEQARDTDAEDGELEALIVAWHGCFQDKPKTCREAIDAASSGIYNGVNVGGLYDAIRAATHEKDAMSAAKLGVYLGRVSGRMCRGLRFVLHGKQRGNRCWKVV